MRTLVTEKRIIIALAFLLMLSFLFSAFTLYKSLNLKPGQEVVAPGGITVAKPSNNIVDATLDSDGILTVKYEDGTQKQVGYVIGPRGAQGEQGIPPTQAQVAAAVLDYCTTNNRCDGQSPTAAQVATAVSNYCLANNNCKGDTGPTGAAGQNGTNGTNGADGQNATTEQIMAAVANYCSDGRCKGAQGEQGIPGTDGRDPVMSCVQRDNGDFVAWKYSTEANTAYRDIYSIPPLGQGQNCIDLRSA